MGPGVTLGCRREPSSRAAKLQRVHIYADRLQLSPSDVTAFLACEHLTTLSLRHAREEFERPAVVNEQADLIKRKGDEHERAYLAKLRADGLTVHEIEFDGQDWEDAQARTVAAIQKGFDVVYQGVFAHDRWRGVADFLFRQPGGTYEALDTKLARTTKPAYILQLLFYNEQLARVQRQEPNTIHVLLGSGAQASFNPRDFAAYYRRVRSRLEAFVAEPPPTEPYPVDHCAICDFKPLCDAYWDSVDHLSRVAGLYRTQIEKLAAAGITTLAQLGRAPAEPAPAGIATDTWAKLREQAELQLHARETGANAFRLLEPQPESGFALLPDPSPGDLFFDFEGNPFWDKDGSLEYLWGILDVERTLHAAARTRPRDGAARVRDASSTSCTRGSSSTRRCTSTTTRPTRSPRSSASWAATARARRSSTTCCGAASSSTSTRSSATASAPRGPATG